MLYPHTDTLPYPISFRFDARDESRQLEEGKTVKDPQESEGEGPRRSSPSPRILSLGRVLEQVLKR